MTLTHRLTWFHLATVSVVLILFSATIYLITRWHFLKQVDDLVATGNDALMAVVEVESDGLEWERHHRRLFAGEESKHLVWAVYDEQGRRVDGTDDSPTLSYAISTEASSAGLAWKTVDWKDRPWRVVVRMVQHPRVKPTANAEGRQRYRQLVLMTAWPLSPVYDFLRTLGWTLAGVAVGLGTTVALGSFWISRQALSPVRRLTDAVKRISAATWEDRLPTVSSDDELQELVQSFNELLDRLQESYLRQQRLTAEASHQLRTPLTALLGQFEVALRREREPSDYRQILATGVVQAQRMRQIVEALLFLARSNADSGLPDKQALDLGAWLPQHLQESWSNYPQYAALMVQNTDQQSIWIETQPVLLGQALDNLIDNALKYSSDGSPVKVALQIVEGSAVLYVEDQGPGLPPTEAHRVFEPFFRSAEARQRGVPGVGLGLSIASRIVKSLGGELQLERHQGGCLFVMKFPQIDTPPAAHRVGNTG